MFHPRNGEERKKVVKPLRLQKSKSAECSLEIAVKENKNEETGIAARTRSKCEIDMPELELKNALKKRTPKEN